MEKAELKVQNTENNEEEECWQIIIMCISLVSSGMVKTVRAVTFIFQGRMKIIDYQNMIWTPNKLPLYAFIDDGQLHKQLNVWTTTIWLSL